MTKKLPLIIAALWLAATAHGANSRDSGTSAGVMLSQPGSARLLAMGTAGSAAASGQEGIWWNPAALARYPFFNAEVSFRRHWTDTEVGYFGLAAPTAWGTFGLGYEYAQTAGIESYDSLDNPGELFTTKDMDLKAAYAFRWQQLFLGLQVEYLYQDLYAGQVHGLGGDLGVVWEFRPGLSIGAAVLHAGETTAGNALSREIRTGFHARALDNLGLTFDVVIPRDDEAYLAGGAEYCPWPNVALRAGWRNGPGTIAQWGNGAGLTIGAGFSWQDIYVDYVFEPSGFLENVHHLSLGYRFQERPARPTPSPTPFAPAEPQLKIQTRQQMGNMVFVPKPVAQNFKIKGYTFKIKDREGNVVKTFEYIGKAAPKQMIWDGTDDQGRKVPKGEFAFSFEYKTDKGVTSETWVWPVQSPVRKLYFRSGGRGVSPEAVFAFSGGREKIKSWRIRIFEKSGDATVRVLTGQDILPEEVVWDGRDLHGRWAAPDRKYGFETQLVSQDNAEALIRDDIIPVPAKMLASRDNRIRFRILQILFDFNDVEITTEMEDKIAKAVEIYQRCGRDVRVTIQGHADEVGTAWANYNISRKRAEEVKAHMRKMGIANWELGTEGYGKDRAVTKSRKEDQRAKNRRVEIQIEIPKYGKSIATDEHR